MEKEKLNELLDSIYELEGLVHLAITREDSPDKLPELIRRKSRELLQHAERATATVEIADTVSEPEPQPIPESESIPEPQLIPEEETGVAVPDSTVTADVMQESVVEPLSGEIDDIPVISPVNDNPIRETVRETYKFDDYSEPRGRLVFSINDRYRFKRELFNKSDSDFNTTLSLVASMDSYDEAEDYFLNELQWDEKSPEVIDFLEILKKYFKE